MAKLNWLLNSQGQHYALLFECKGCDMLHQVWVADTAATGGPVWTWNQDMERPTFSPSIRVSWDQWYPSGAPPEQQQAKHMVCHSFITDGRIQYLSDCTHDLAGQTIDLPEIER